MPTETQWAWIAGIFEGEGTITFVKRTSVTCAVQMGDRDVLERLQGFVPTVGGVRLARRGRGGCRDQYAWVLTGRDRIGAFLLGISPWLGARRSARAEEALHRLSRNRGRGQDRTHCPHGHLYAGANLYLTPRGYRQCVTCRKGRA